MGRPSAPADSPTAAAATTDPGRAARLAAVVLGGIVGVLLRYGQSLLLNGGPGTYPWGTFTINVAGSVALGAFLAALLETPGVHPLWRPFFATGFCGTYTTFSSFESETFGLARGGDGGLAGLYGVASVGVGLAAALVTWRLVRRRRRPSARLERRPPLLLAPVLTSLGAAAVALALVRERDLGLAPIAITLLVVTAGGCAGAIARFGVGSFLTARLGSTFPWGTLAINLTGSFLIGLFDGATRGRSGVSPYLRPGLVTGCLGGYTTFSTFACETILLGEESGPGRVRAVANVLASVAGGLAAVAAGDTLGARL